jgi:hypothetical protein
MFSIMNLFDEDAETSQPPARAARGARSSGGQEKADELLPSAVKASARLTAIVFGAATIHMLLLAATGTLLGAVAFGWVPLPDAPWTGVVPWVVVAFAVHVLVAEAHVRHVMSSLRAGRGWLARSGFAREAKEGGKGFATAALNSMLRPAFAERFLMWSYIWAVPFIGAQTGWEAGEPVPQGFVAASIAWFTVAAIPVFWGLMRVRKLAAQAANVNRFPADATRDRGVLRLFSVRPADFAVVATLAVILTGDPALLPQFAPWALLLLVLTSWNRRPRGFRRLLDFLSLVFAVVLVVWPTWTINLLDYLAGR